MYLFHVFIYFCHVYKICCLSAYSRLGEDVVEAEASFPLDATAILNMGPGRASLLSTQMLLRITTHDGAVCVGTWATGSADGRRGRGAEPGPTGIHTKSSYSVRPLSGGRG